MIREALEYLRGQVRSDMQAEWLQHPNQRKRLLAQGGAVSEYDAAPPLRAYTVARTADLIRLAKAEGAREGAGALAFVSVVPGVVVLLDRSDRLERVTLYLTQTGQWQRLMALAGPGRSYSPDELRQQLRELGLPQSERVRFAKLSFGDYPLEYGPRNPVFSPRTPCEGRAWIRAGCRTRPTSTPCLAFAARRSGVERGASSGQGLRRPGSGASS